MGNHFSRLCEPELTRMMNEIDRAENERRAYGERTEITYTDIRRLRRMRNQLVTAALKLDSLRDNFYRTLRGRAE